MTRFLKRHFLWILYAIFVIVAIATHKGEPIFYSTGPYAPGKYIVWFMFFAFLAYSLYATTQASFIKSLPNINKYIWGRQIGLDLYISVFMSLFVIYLDTGSIWVLLLWLVPVLIYANLAILLYVALNYGSLVGHFVGS